MKGDFIMFNKETELEKLESQIAELKARKKEILDKAKEEEEKARAEKEKSKARRKKEVEDAYNKFVELLNAYEKDFGGGYKVSLTGSFSM